MSFFDWLKKQMNLRNDNKSMISKADNISYSCLQENKSFENLWYNGTENEWNVALGNYYRMLKPDQIPIEDYINNINADEIKALDEYAFYDFLYNKYFVWKYTAKNRLATTRMSLEKYEKNNELAVLKSIHNRLFSTSKSNIAECLKIACEIRGLGTAGASGLLAILFPENFGTVDQFVVKRLREINHPVYSDVLNNMKPEGLKIKDGVILIEIMRKKSDELNEKFNTDFWTPRKIDMVLWAFDR